MLSERIEEICETLECLYEELAHRITEESGGKFGLCRPMHIQLWADPEAQHDMKELENFVGPVSYNWTGEVGHGYSFDIGTAKAFVVMPPNTSDSRGEPDDVSTNPQAR